uniref:TOG domain-containing protein n=1 Tax=Strigamia maritima TaxID=126957 RepID=T1JB15_STRMM
MPHKIVFRVASVSGEDEKFRAKELNTHGPTIQGWHSPKFMHVYPYPRFCIYPQELTIQLDSRTKICKIQMLSHQFLIATKIDLLVGDMVDDTAIVASQNAVYQLLGSVTLSDNEGTNYKARELKSVHVDAIGIFVKFILHKNYVNRHNLCNQVGLVAVNVIGDDYDDNYSTTEAGAINQRKADIISSLDDLAFDMYQDSEVAHIIRKLETKKQAAILDEQYDLARKLKNVSFELHKAGEKLGKYEIEKKQVTDMSDFDKARQKQHQIEEYRMGVYAQLELHKLLDDDQPAKSSPSPRNEPAEKPLSPDLLPDLLSGKSGADEYFVEEDAGNTFEEYENTTVPALRKRSGLMDEELSDEDATKALKNSKYTLSDRDRREAVLPVDVFGLNLVENAYSKTFSERILALKAIQKHLRDFTPDKFDVSTTKMFKASVFLILKALNDNVLTVFTQAINVLTSLLKRFPENNKIRAAAMNYIITMSEFPELASLHNIPAQCCRPIQSNVTPRLAQSRAELVEQLVMKKGIQGHLTVDLVMNFCAPALQHPLGPVREIAEHIIIHLYKQRPAKEIRKHLPLDDEKPRRNILYRQLYEHLDKIDKLNQPKARLGQDKKNKKKLPAHKEVSEDLISMDMEILDKTCIFCEEVNDSFNNEGLDFHYWKSCPMLIKCRFCRQIVEISALTVHHLTECANKDDFKKCERCQEAIPKSSYQSHVELKSCNPAPPERVSCRCPLCHNNIPPGEESWKKHLTEVNGCPYNCRRNKTKDDHPPMSQSVIVVHEKASRVTLFNLFYWLRPIVHINGAKFAYKLFLISVMAENNFENNLRVFYSNSCYLNKMSQYINPIIHFAIQHEGELRRLEEFSHGMLDLLGKMPDEHTKMYRELPMFTVPTTPYRVKLKERKSCVLVARRQDSTFV